MLATARGWLSEAGRLEAVAQLSEGERQWQQSWRDLGFAPRTADDAQCRRDVEALVAQTGEHDYLQARAQ